MTKLWSKPPRLFIGMRAMSYGVELACLYHIYNGPYGHHPTNRNRRWFLSIGDRTYVLSDAQAPPAAPYGGAYHHWMNHGRAL